MELDAIASQSGVFITTRKQVNATNKNPKAHVLWDNTLLIIQLQDLLNAVALKTLSTLLIKEHVLNSSLRGSALKDR